MTSSRRHRLRIDLTDWQGQRKYAECDNFKVGSERDKYKLISVGKCVGNAGQYRAKTCRRFGS